MPDVEPPGWLRSWIATSLAPTVYASVGVSMGAILYLVAPYFGGHPWGWFFAGSCIPPGIVSLINTSDWMFRRRLRNLKRLFDEGPISAELYELDRKRAMDWRTDRLYGRATASSPRPKPVRGRRPKPAIASTPAEQPPPAIPRPEDPPEASA